MYVCVEGSRYVGTYVVVQLLYLLCRVSTYLCMSLQDLIVVIIPRYIHDAHNTWKYLEILGNTDM